MPSNTESADNNSWFIWQLSWHDITNSLFSLAFAAVAGNLAQDSCDVDNTACQITRGVGVGFAVLATSTWLLTRPNGGSETQRAIIQLKNEILNILKHDINTNFKHIAPIKIAKLCGSIEYFITEVCPDNSHQLSHLSKNQLLKIKSSFEKALQTTQYIQKNPILDATTLDKLNGLWDKEPKELLALLPAKQTITPLIAP